MSHLHEPALSQPMGVVSDEAFGSGWSAPWRLRGSGLAGTLRSRHCQPFDQLLDFRDGLDHRLANPVQPVILAFYPPRIESITTSSPIDEGGTATITVTALAVPQGPSQSPSLTYQFDPSDSGIYSLSNQTGVVSLSFPRPGSFLIPIRVVTPDRTFALGQASIEVLNVAPTIVVAGNQTAIEGTPTKFNLGQFSDPGSLETFRLVVNWADQTSTSSMLGVGIRSFAASHVYTSVGIDMVAVTTTDHGGGQVTGTATVVVVAPATALSPAPNIPPVPSPLFTTLAFFNSSTSKAITTSASNSVLDAGEWYLANATIKLFDSTGRPRSVRRPPTPWGSTCSRTATARSSTTT